MDTIERIARHNRWRAEEVIRDSRLAEIWRSVGAEVRQVGSLRSGLLMKHRDIDFHIYSSPLRLEESFAAMAQLAADPAVGRIECRNLLATDEACVEWHATYRDRDGDEWQLDMIHIVRGSRYDGYFEHVADRIAAALTPVYDFSRKNAGTPSSTPPPKQTSCRLVRLNSTLVLTLVKSFGTLT